MGKETDRFVKDFKGIKKQAADLSLATGEKQKKDMQAFLSKVWAAEDVLQEAIQKARAGGVTSKKSSDFVKHAEVVKPLKKWDAMLKEHHQTLVRFTKFNADVKALNGSLTKRMALVEKEAKQSAPAREAAAMIKEAQSKILPDLKKSQALLGTLKSFEVYYGAKYQKTVDAIVKQAIDAVTPKEFPEPLSDKNRASTAKEIKQRPRDIDKMCKQMVTAMKNGDLAAAEEALKKARILFSALEGFEKVAKQTKSKMKKEIKADDKSKEITALIGAIHKAHKKYLKQLDDMSKILAERKSAAD